MKTKVSSPKWLPPLENLRVYRGYLMFAFSGSKCPCPRQTKVSFVLKDGSLYSDSPWRAHEIPWRKVAGWNPVSAVNTVKLCEEHNVKPPYFLGGMRPGPLNLLLSDPYKPLNPES